METVNTLLVTILFCFDFQRPALQLDDTFHTELVKNRMVPVSLFQNASLTGGAYVTNIV